MSRCLAGLEFLDVSKGAFHLFFNLKLEPIENSSNESTNQMQQLITGLLLVV